MVQDSPAGMKVRDDIYRIDVVTRAGAEQRVSLVTLRTTCALQGATGVDQLAMGHAPAAADGGLATEDGRHHAIADDEAALPWPEGEERHPGQV